VTITAPLTYQQNPRPVGYPISFKLDGDRLVVDSGRKLQEVRLGAVQELRLTYEPRSFAQRAFRTTLRLSDGKSVSLNSMNWKSLIEAQNQAPEYRAFVLELIRSVAAANPQARFRAGRRRVAWLAIVAISAASLVTIALFIWRAFQTGANSAGLMGLLLGAAGVWQLEPMVRLNKPRTFDPEVPPADLLG